MSASADSRTTVVVVGPDGTEDVLGRLDAVRADLALVDALARLQLGAKRRGRRILILHPSPELCRLLELVGLDDVLGLEPGRQPELLEELGVDEVVEPGDLPL